MAKKTSLGIPKWAFKALTKDRKSEVVGQALTLKSAKVGAEQSALLTDSDARSKLLRAVPWILGGLAVVIGVAVLSKKRRK